MRENKNYGEIKKLIDDLISKFGDGKYIFRGMKRAYNEDKEINSSLFRKYKNVWTLHSNLIPIVFEIPVL